MQPCNHPNCNKGVMVETIGSMTQFKQCPYCVRDNDTLETQLIEIRKQRLEVKKLMEKMEVTA